MSRRSIIAMMRKAGLDTQTITVGGTTVYVDVFWTEYHGYNSLSSPPAFGSIADGTFNVKSGATIRYLFWFLQDDGNKGLYFQINGTHTNDGWTTIKIGSTTYNRADASFSNGGGVTTWGWSSDNPFVGFYPTAPVEFA